MKGGNDIRTNLRGSSRAENEMGLIIIDSLAKMRMIGIWNKKRYATSRTVALTTKM